MQETSNIKFIICDDRKIEIEDISVLVGPAAPTNLLCYTQVTVHIKDMGEKFVTVKPRPLWSTWLGRGGEGIVQKFSIVSNSDVLKNDIAILDECLVYLRRVGFYRVEARKKGVVIEFSRLIQISKEDSILLRHICSIGDVIENAILST
jgi:hypothetical protein